MSYGYVARITEREIVRVDGSDEQDVRFFSNDLSGFLISPNTG